MEGDNDQLRAVIKADPLTTTWEVAEEFNVDHSLVIQHLKQIGKVKKLDKWVSHELTESQKVVILKCCLLLSMQQQRTISCSDCDVWGKVDFLWQPAITNTVAALRRSSKALPKARLAPKRSWSLLGGLLPVLINYSFLKPSETITYEMYAQ